MAVTIHRLLGEPIILATLTQSFTVEDVEKLYQETTRLGRDIEGAVYRITDATRADVSIANMVRIAERACVKCEGGTTDSRLVPVLVGSGERFDMMVDALRDHDIDLPVYPTVDAALKAIREETHTGHEPVRHYYARRIPPGQN